MDRRSFLLSLGGLAVTACRGHGPGVVDEGAGATQASIEAMIRARLAESPVDYVSLLEANPNILRRAPEKAAELRRRLREDPRVGREMNEFRVAALMKLASADIDPRAKALMLDTHLEKIPHAVTTCMEHFLGVHDLLKKWRGSEDIANIGLLHAIYGTEYFVTDVLDYRRAGDRERVRRVVGERSERWIAQYGLMLSREFVDDTRKAGRPAMQLDFFERTDAVPATLTEEDFHVLADVQVANAYEPFTHTGKAADLAIVVPYAPLRAYVSAGAQSAIDMAQKPALPG